MGDLVEVGLGLDEPNVQDVQPLGEELGLEELREHRRSKDVSPREDVFEGSEDLVSRVDFEVVSKSGTELGKDVLEDQRIPFVGREDLGNQRAGERQRWSTRKSDATSRIETHILPLPQLLRHPLLNLPPLEHSSHPPLRISQNLLHPISQERQPGEDDPLQRSSSIPRLPFRDGLVDFGKDELIEDVVVEEAREKRDPGFEEVDGGGGFFRRPVVAGGGKGRGRGRGQLSSSTEDEKGETMEEKLT